MLKYRVPPRNARTQYVSSQLNVSESACTIMRDTTMSCADPSSKERFQDQSPPFSRIEPKNQFHRFGMGPRISLSIRSRSLQLWINPER
jgi:hypothetical protein